MGKSDQRRERELMKRAARINRMRPGEDEFDEAYRNWMVAPGAYIFWMAIVRTWRAIVRLVRKRSRERPAAPQQRPQRSGAKSPPPRQRPWTIGPKALDTEE